MKKKFYITAAIPYVNASPHLGHALEFIQADVIARYHQLLGEKVIFVSGADENAQKNVQSALEKKTTPQKLCQKNAQAFLNLKKLLHLCDCFVFQRSSAKNHYRASQKLWLLCKKEDIYKKFYQGLYCQGCEEFKKESELKNGYCPEHPNKKLEKITEENYFFRLSAYQKFLEKTIQENKLKIFPQERKKEVLNFIKRGLEDFSISRSTLRMKGWGIPVPNDPSQTIYVWFDALNVYQSAVGFGSDEKKYRYWWPADLHCLGKGITKFHAVYWPAILKSAGLKLPKALFVHGYLTINKQKISKTLGNIIAPQEITNKYQAEALRYFLLKIIHPYHDGDFSLDLFNKIYNADLANGLGNLVQRLAKLSQNAKLKVKKNKFSFKIQNYQTYCRLLNSYKFNETLAWIWRKISQLDKYIDKNKPWEKPTPETKKILQKPIKEILKISFLLKPFLPETSAKIEKIFTAKNIKAPKISLFPKIK